MTLIFHIPYKTGVSFIADKKCLRLINGRTPVISDCHTNAEKVFGYKNAIVGFYGMDFTTGDTYNATIKKALIKCGDAVSIESLNTNLLDSNNLSALATTPASPTIDIKQATFIIAIKINNGIESYKYLDGNFEKTNSFFHVGINIIPPIISLLEEELLLLNNLDQADSEMLGAILIDNFYKYKKYEVEIVERKNYEEININNSRIGGLDAISLNLEGDATEIKRINQTCGIIKFIEKMSSERKIKDG